jgi:hypothetical protein
VNRPDSLEKWLLLLFNEYLKISHFTHLCLWFALRLMLAMRANRLI